MKKRWLLVFVAAIMLLVFPVVSLAGGNEVQLEGETGPVESASESPSTEPTPAPTPEPTPVPVSTPAPTVKLDHNSISVLEGIKFSVGAVTSPAGLELTWQTSGDISRVEGQFLAYGAPGTARIVVYIAGTDICDSCDVTILPNKVTGINIPKSSYTIAVGEKIIIDVAYTPETAINKGVNWSSSDWSVATFTRNPPEFRCTVTGQRAGTTIIKATADGGFSDSCQVIVVDPSAAPTPLLASASVQPQGTSSAEATSTPGPTRGAGESGGPQPTRIPVQLDATGWEAAEEAILGMEPGSLGSIPMPEDTLVPASLLLTLKQTQCALEIDMGGYTCTIDGADLAEMPDCMELIDIGMTMEKDAKLSAACGGNAYELRFNYHGELPGVFTFRVKAEGSSPGDLIYVYFYDEEAGVFESHVAATVDDEGNVSFGITHCSSYCITSEMIPGALNNFELPAEATEKPEAERASGFAAFVEDNYIAFWVCVYALGCAAVVTVFVVIFHRRGRKRAAEQTFIKQ